MPGLQGTDLLAKTREIFPDAKRVLLTAYSDIDAAIKAINVAHLDHYLSKPWTPPEECLFPVLDDLLDNWQADYLPETKGLRLVGHQWSPRSHENQEFPGRQSDSLPLARRDAGSGHPKPAGRGRDRRRRASRLVLRGRRRAAQSGSASGGRADRAIARGRVQSVRPRDRGRRTRGPGRGGLRRVRGTTNAPARSARTRRTGGQQLQDRELSRVPHRREWQ